MAYNILLWIVIVSSLIEVYYSLPYLNNGEVFNKLFNNRELDCSTDVNCPTPLCVDSEQIDGNCCRSCPNGNNCWHNGELLPHGRIVTESINDPRCEKICLCPSEELYREYRDATPAICIVTCT